MDRHTFLAWTTSSQWVLFLAVILIIFSWVEKKQKIQQAGQLLFFLLGVLSLWIVLTGQITVPETSAGGDVPSEAKALTYFTGLAFTGLLGLISFILSLKKTGLAKWFTFLTSATAVVLFFMVYHIQKHP